jgi:hypothetical protein
VSVYFATCRQANAVKIGSSVDPWGRLPELMTGCPLPVTIEAIMHGGHEEEFAYHRRFEDVRIHREWFTITDMIEAIMAASPAGPQPQKLTRTIRPIVEAKRQARLSRHIPLREISMGDIRAGDREIKKRLASGDIYFPFRALEDTE